jgi:hypothetical protein
MVQRCDVELFTIRLIARRLGMSYGAVQRIVSRHAIPRSGGAVSRPLAPPVMWVIAESCSSPVYVGKPVPDIRRPWRAEFSEDRQRATQVVPLARLIVTVRDESGECDIHAGLLVPGVDPLGDRAGKDGAVQQGRRSAAHQLGGTNEA